MKNWSIPVGRIFGVELRIHATFALLLIFLVATGSVRSGTLGGVRSLVLLGIIFGSVILHELGHAVTAMKFGVVVRSIVLLPIGGITLMDDQTRNTPNPGRDIRISLAGPMVNIVLAVFFGTGALLFLPQVKLFDQPWVSSASLIR